MKAPPSAEVSDRIDRVPSLAIRAENGRDLLIPNIPLARFGGRSLFELTLSIFELSYGARGRGDALRDRIEERTGRREQALDLQIEIMEILSRKASKAGVSFGGDALILTESERRGLQKIGRAAVSEILWAKDILAVLHDLRAVTQAMRNHADALATALQFAGAGTSPRHLAPSPTHLGALLYTLSLSPIFSWNEINPFVLRLPREVPAERLALRSLGLEVASAGSFRNIRGHRPAIVESVSALATWVQRSPAASEGLFNGFLGVTGRLLESMKQME
jgi:hypothetical protein